MKSKDGEIFQKGVGLVSVGRSPRLFKDGQSIIEDWGGVVFRYVFKQNNHHNKKYLLLLQNVWFFKWNSPKPLSQGPAVLILNAGERCQVGS